MPYSQLAKSMLERESVFHEVFGGELVVTGNDAQRFAEVFHVETRRPMLRGVLNPQEPHSLPVMRSIIARLVGQTGAPGRKIFFSIPAPCSEGDAAIAYHEALHPANSEAVRLRRPAYSRRAGRGVSARWQLQLFQGSGFPAAAVWCNVCLAVLSVPVIHFAIPKAAISSTHRRRR